MRGVVVVVVGPDGAGKSSVADGLEDALVPPFAGVDRVHWRPMVLPRPGALRGRPPRDVTEPHAAPPHPRWLSILLLGYYLADHWLGHVLGTVPARHGGRLVLVERGWHDMAVDPRRYRLDVPPRLVLGLGRLLPRPDARFVLDGAPQDLHERKPELAPDEIARQCRAWRDIAAAQPETVVVDAGPGVAAVVASIRRHVVTGTRAGARRQWVALPSRRSPRLQVPRAPRAAAVDGIRLYQPSAPLARAATAAAGVVARSGALRLVPSAGLVPGWVDRALAAHVPPGGTFALLASSHPDRWVARVVDAKGRPVAVAKVVGPDGDRSALAGEAAALAGLARTLPSPLRAPELLDHADGLLVVEAVAPRRRRRPCELPPEVAHALGAWFGGGVDDTGVGPSHGDCAPWNLLRVQDGWVLVDWEHARDTAPPFQDVLHYLTQGHALVGSPARDELLAGVGTGAGRVGAALRAYALGAGLDVHGTADHLRAYLATPQAVLRPTGPGSLPEGHAARRALLDALA